MKSCRSPEFITDAEDVDVLTELMQREPIFHHPEFGRTRQELENIVSSGHDRPGWIMDDNEYKY